MPIFDDIQAYIRKMPAAIAAAIKSRRPLRRKGMAVVNDIFVKSNLLGGTFLCVNLLPFAGSVTGHADSLRAGAGQFRRCIVGCRRSAVISEAASDAAPATAETPAASSRDTTTEQRNVLDGFVDFLPPTRQAAA